MIVVTTPTGNIASKVVTGLLEAGEMVRVIVRDPAKLTVEVRSKVEVVVGSHDDDGVMLAALEGAESLFLLAPPSFTTTDPLEQYMSFTRAAAKAMKARGVTRVVTVSGMGRDAGMDAGVVSSSFAKDELLERSGFDVRVLWCPGFMDNTLRNLPTLKQQGMIFGPSLAERKIPQVATRDIATSGVRLLMDRTWTGQGGLALLGPEDLSPNEMAAIVGEVLGKPIRYQEVPRDAYKAQMMQHGASEEMAEGLMVMFDAKNNGLDNKEPRTKENTTPTSFKQWCEEVLKPAYESM